MSDPQDTVDARTGSPGVRRDDAGEASALSGALHEVSNALTVVLGWLAEARALVSSDSDVARALDVAYIHARRGHSVAREAIGGSVSVAGGARSALSLLRDAVRAGSPEAASCGVKLTEQGEAQDLSLGDWEAALQVLVNLVLNALSFAPRGSRVTVAYRAAQDRAVFTVSDEGPGVPPALRPRLFVGGRSMRPGGAGIGLAHSYALARARGGRLSLLDSERGACFELVWPVSNEPSQTVAQSPALADISGMRVVVLEDDPAVMTMVEFGLESRGVEVFKATSEEEFLELSVATRPDAALIDLSPIRRGPREILREFHRRHGPVPIVLISGAAISESADLPLSGWVEKPFELAELYAALASLQHEAGDALRHQANG